MAMGMDDYIKKHGVAKFLALPETDFTDPKFARWGVRDEVADLNERHCFVMADGAAVILNEGEDADNPGQKRLTFSKPHDLHHSYSNRMVPEKLIDEDEGDDDDSEKKPKPPKMVRASDLWMRSEDRREAMNGLVMLPDRRPGVDVRTSTFNVFNGLGVEPHEPDDEHSWSLLRDHISNVICSGNPEHAEYVLKWFAWGFQNLTKKPETSIVLIGKQGVGKGILLKAVARLYGQHAVQLSQARQLTGNFNMHLMNKLYAFADEAFFHGDRAGMNVLKGIITEPKLLIEPKGVNAFEVNSYLRVVMSSNEMHAVFAGPDARRFAVFDVPATKKANLAYFERIGSQLDSGGYEAMLWDMLHMDVSKFRPQVLPKTAALLRQKKLSLGDVEQWWFDRLMDGVLRMSDDQKSDWSGFAFVHSIVASVGDRCVTLWDKKQLETKVGIAMHDMCPHLRPAKVKVGTKVSGIRRLRGYQVGTLNECREAFEEYIECPIDWETGDIE